MEENKIAAFVRKKRKVQTQTVEIKEVKTPWYKRPIERTAFVIRESIDGKFYAQHNEWSKRVWIGPYKSEEETIKVIDSYVNESLKGTLDKKPINSIHSVIIEDGQIFKTL